MKLSNYSDAIGQDTAAAIRSVLNWLYETKQSSWTELESRIAPSFVTRSESEYLGLSSPRFAVRFVMTEGNGFLNLRRLKDLRQAISDRLGGITLSERRFRNAVADSFLRLPRRLSEGKSRYFALHAREALIGYGEGDRVDELCSPYVTQLDFLGGGVCAECVAMMAVQILHRYCDRVNGVAEINAISLSLAAEIMPSGGMSGVALIHYFCQKDPGPGLQAYGQTAILPMNAFPAPSAEYEHWRRNAAFGWAMRAYIASGFPVVLSVDLTRMNADLYKIPLRSGQDILSANRVPESVSRDGWSLVGRERRHCVLLVGCDSALGYGDIANDLDQHFLVHCPQTAPFLQATVAQLVDITSDAQALRAASFISVTPGGVLVPLASGRSTGLQDKSPVIDLCEVAFFIQRTGNRLHYGPELRVDDRSGPGVFRLIDLDDWDVETNRPKMQQLADWELKPGQRCDFPIDRLGPAITMIAQDRLLHDSVTPIPRWVWVQYHDNPQHGRNVEWLWVWNAEVIPAAGYLAAFDETGQSLLTTYLVAKFTYAGTDWRKDAAFRSKNHDCPPRYAQPNSPRELIPSLINSFDVEGDRKRFPLGQDGYEWWPRLANGNPVPCEYYMVMEHRLRAWLAGPLSRFDALFGKRKTAIRLLELLANYPELLIATSDEVHRTYAPDVSIVALASFFQEHAAEEAARLAAGKDAILGLAKLALDLKLRHGHPVSVVEIVAGTRLSDVKAIVPLQVAIENIRLQDLVGPDSPLTLVAELIDPERVEEMFSRNIKNAILPVKEELRENGITIAVEMEPGPLFINRDSSTLSRLSDKFEVFGLKGLCAFNLDISHAIQAGCRPEDVSHIQFVHSHVSGRDAKAHVGDTPLDEADAEVMRPWIKVLRGIHGQGPLHVSIESEACSGFASVEASVRALEKILRSILDSEN